jgi:cobalt-zinc-cadmium efflux system membrane fusion protein
MLNLKPLAAAALCAAAVSLLPACSPPAAPAAPSAAPSVSGEVLEFPDKKDPPALRTAAVTSAADLPVLLTGRLAWNEEHTARVYAPFAGRIERLLVLPGQKVARGQPLATLSSADVGQAQADLQKATADQALSKLAVARARSLSEAGVIARKDLEAAEADLARGEAEAARARGRLAQYGLGAGATGMGYTLNAPVAGVVVERNSNPGAEVRTDLQGAPLFVISDPASLWVTLDVDETQLALIKPGQTVQLGAAAWPDKRFEATVLSLGEAVDPATRTVKARAAVANPERLLKAEMFVSAQLANPHGLPLVPADAVFLRGDKRFVFVAQGNGRYERRAVQVRQAGPQHWSVLQGLKAGERVVVGGALFLSQQLDTAQ